MGGKEEESLTGLEEKRQAERELRQMRRGRDRRRENNSEEEKTKRWTKRR